MNRALFTAAVVAFSCSLLTGATGAIDDRRGAGTTPIYTLQGATHLSGFAGSLVTTSGVVTAVDSNGFFLQDPVGDGNPATSDAIFVFTSSPPTVGVGDIAEVTATVSEFIPGGAGTGNLSITELISPAVTVTGSGAALPAPVIIGDAGRQPPTEIIDNDLLAIFDPDEDGIDFYESLEAMRVTIADAVAVSATNRFAEIFTLSDNGDFASGRNLRGGITISAGDFNPERIQIQFDGGILPGPALSVDTGDSLGDVTGVVHYSFGNFEVKPTEALSATDAGLSAEVTTLTGSADWLTVAAFNVENLDINPGDGDDDVGSGMLASLAAQIAVNLAAPDIVALQEIQDNDGAADTGTVDASLTYGALIDAVSAAGGPDYEFADIAPANNADGGQPGGNIRVGYLYDPARVELISLTRITDPDTSDGDAFAASRKPLHGQFRFNSQDVDVVNVHFSSKGGGTPLFGAVQPPVNGNVERRVDQAGVVNDYVDTLLAAGRDRIVVTGDVNEFTFESPMAVLEGGADPVLTNLTETLPEPDRYTFVFRGNAQALDHALVSAPVVASGVFYDIVHANVEFATAPTDHDAVIVELRVPGDGDGDGFADDRDNCVLVANANQRDTDGDNIGNICDADFNNDCVLNFVDLSTMRSNFFASGDLDTDLDGDGSTNFADLFVLQAGLFGPPGPSGVPNVCSIR